jgi:hypothetical protein
LGPYTTDFPYRGHSPFPKLPTNSKRYLGEVNLQINETIYRIIIDFPLDSITHTWLLEKASAKIQECYGEYSEKIVLKYKTRSGQLAAVSPNFPHDTDDGWREFFAGVFYILDLDF